MDKPSASSSLVWRTALSVVALLMLAVLAFVQGVAIWQLAPGATALGPLLPALLLDAVCGALQAVLFRSLLPPRYREPRGFTLLFLWLVCTFAPVAGGLVLLASCVWAACFPKRRGDDDLQQVPAPEFVTYLMSRVSHGGGARLQARLVNTQVNASDRLSALVAIQSMPTRTTGTLLRDLLADPIEDVRLIAYGTLDQAENDVMQKIFQTAQTLELAQNDSERRAINRQLAELYFELVYQNLVQGAVYTHTLEQADCYARAALEIDDGDAALWLIRGRLALAHGEAGEAAAHMARAQALGFPRERLVPWLAEAAFLQHDYARVSELLASLGHASSLPMLKPVVRYWST
jgi:polysaccharide biosynthesis protein PelE